MSASKMKSIKEGINSALKEADDYTAVDVSGLNNEDAGDKIYQSIVERGLMDEAVETLGDHADAIELSEHVMDSIYYLYQDLPNWQDQENDKKMSVYDYVWESLIGGFE